MIKMDKKFITIILAYFGIFMILLLSLVVLVNKNRKDAEIFMFNPEACRVSFEIYEDSYCGDGVCNEDETSSICPVDCPNVSVPGSNPNSTCRIYDLNKDGRVNMLDFYMFRNNYGKSSEGSDTVLVGDFNNDNTVDILDLAVFASNYGCEYE